ncbi:hypothetical protein DCAR_0312126 [Daucus carota subsp. sativus]|uniref:RBR-type E3 ubiquitin transferase n=1 Tax=Daucus carota subsp. sativus TaxID=79200 RepID=A0AAF1ARL1_DAUCS|nr:PREDICTED: E3 ubiquitin-protein ligase RNF14 [Daucus carota subsp. sativus]WOG92849.1 hypothetical protein DCAR_0312126 [Daucus carota subsp. sativus]
MNMSTRTQPHKNQSSSSSTFHSKPTKKSHSDRPKSKCVPRNKPDSVAKSCPEVGSCQEQKVEEDCAACDQQAVKEFEGGLGVKMVDDSDEFGSEKRSGGEDEIVTRLEELLLGSTEVELSREIWSVNDQLQQDELIAMESIYGENLVISDQQRGLRCFQIYVHIESLKDITISTQLNSSSHVQITSDDTPEFSYSFKVQYLPPIVLTCLFPRSYPSHLPPYYTMSVQWLDSSKISSLCCMLDSIWNEQPGQEIIYQWVEWLQSSSLPYLGFDEEVILGPYDIIHIGDKRAISASVSPDVDIPSLKSYNDEQCHVNFVKNFHECHICYSEYPGVDFIRLSCHHFFCWRCMETYVSITAKEGTKTKVLCPEEKCEGVLPSGLLKRLLGDKEFQRWETLIMQKTLASMSDVVYCPRCETTCFADEDNDAQCSKCFYSFCSLCSEKRHVGTSCMSPEMKLLVLQERQNSTQLGGERKRREKEMINEILSVKEILRDAKQCPSCKMAISRTEGCNKMVCNNCGNYFCYRCNQKIDGYDHFKGECELFPQEMIQTWERANARMAEGQILAGLFGAQGHPCPLCGQVNAKVGNNNHIFCWACRNHYCYLCKKIVKRGSNHYGPKGCKQHTEG